MNERMRERAIRAILALELDRRTSQAWAEYGSCAESYLMVEVALPGTEHRLTVSGTLGMMTTLAKILDKEDHA